MTIYQLKKLNKVNGGTFFDRDKMKETGQTLKKLGVFTFPKTGHHQVYSRTMAGRNYLFHRDTGRLIFENED